VIIHALAAQFHVTESIRNNLKEIETVLAQSRAGDLLLFPEGSLSGYLTEEKKLQKINQSELKEAIRHIQRQAEIQGVNAWIGACVLDQGRWFNSAYGCCADGKTRVYRKINLATRERGVFSPGNELPVFVLQTPEGSFKVGVQICRELRYPEQWGWLARQGAQIILHLNNAVGDASAFPVWRSHLVSRAAETQRFVVSANNAAPVQNCPTILLAPSGQALGEIVSAEAGLLQTDLDLTQVSDWNISQSRSDVVSIRPSGGEPV
jgi:predicted amidohydrolase